MQNTPPTLRPTLSRTIIERLLGHVVIGAAGGRPYMID
jgi:hypothetical protein